MDNISPGSSGASQEQRLLPALQGDYFQVDEMSFETLLLLARSFAGQLPFYGLDNKVSGTWGALFFGNEVVIMAMILNVDPKAEQAKFGQLKASGLQQVLAYLLKQYRYIDLWYRQLKRSSNPAAYELQLKISSVIEQRLASRLRQVLMLLKGLRSKEEASIDPLGFDPLWQLDQDDSGEGTCEDLGGQNGESALSLEISQALYSAFSVLINAIQYLQTSTRAYLEQALLSPSQEPAFALLLAFLKLFSKAQEKINSFTGRHLDFYYRQLLKFSPLPVTPDAAHLLLALEKGTSEPLEIRRGHKFSAGKDGQFNPIVYCADENLVVTDAQVAQVKTLHLHRDPLISPERELAFVNQISANALAQAKEGETPPAIAIFGADNQVGQPSPASMALVISAGIFHLKEGERKLELTFTLAEPYRLNSQIFTLLNKKPDALADKKTALAGVFSLLLNTEDYLAPFPEVLARPLILVDTLSQSQLDSVFNCPVAGRDSEIYKVFLLALLKLSRDKKHLYRLVGQIFTRHSLSQAPWLTLADIKLIREKCAAFSGDQALEQVLALLSQKQEITFYQFYGEMFDINISTTQGWQSISDYFLHPLQVTNNSQQLGLYGFKLTLCLGQDFPEIISCDPEIHTKQWQLPDPVMQLTIRQETHFFPYSVFSELALQSLDIEVEVKGITELVVYNQLGRLDPAKAFMPFGPQANNHSHFIFSSEEIAYKPLKQLTVNINWAELPLCFDGFAEHYNQYDSDYSNDSFEVALSVLKDGLWQTPGNGVNYPLFHAQPGSNKIAREATLTADVSQIFKAALTSPASEKFDFNLKSRNGFFKLTLVEPSTAFGHQQYAGLLTQRILENARKKKQQPLPNVPYTPKIAGITLDYRAKKHLDLATESEAGQLSPVSIIHQHPFGVEKIYPPPKHKQKLQHKACFLFPRYRDQGNLFLGLSATKLQGKLNLFFHLDEKATGIRQGESANIQWFYLANNQWKKLKQREIMADTTNGFLTSGIVTLDVPEAINTDNTVMTPGLFWLRASTNCQVFSYGRCYSVSTHGIKVTREALPGQDQFGDSQNLLSPVVISDSWQPLDKVAGLGQIRQKTATFGGKRPENEHQLKKRASERLRHKGRALAAWDYERLILQQFPQIDRVKCLANTVFGQKGLYPGKVLIIVRRKVELCNHQGCDDFKVGADELIAIRQFIQSKSSAFVSVDVRAPEYEKIQVRCAVSFVAGEHKGLASRRLNQAISDLICPWNLDGLNPGFGWCLDIKKIESFISSLSYVNFVTDFSLLHIIPLAQKKNRFYRLTDTAREQGAESGQVSDNLGHVGVSPGYPWSILMPVTQHYIESSPSSSEIPAKITGIDELQVGQNFIIRDKTSDLDNESCALDHPSTNSSANTSTEGDC